MSDAYDAGLLNDWGGGNVEWWQDYIRAELERSHEFYAASIADLERQLAEARADAEQAVAVAYQRAADDYLDKDLPQMARNVTRAALKGDTP